MARNGKKEKKTKLLRGSMPGIRPRHIEAIRKLGKTGTEAELFESLGYKKSYAKNGDIKKTKSWKAISEEMLPNDLLAEVNQGLLKHKSWQARSSGLDKAYKAKKIYNNGIEITNKFAGYSKEEIIKSILRRIAGDSGGD